MKFEHRKENEDNRRVGLERAGFLFASCCLRYSFEKEPGVIIELTSEFGLDEYRKPKNKKILASRKIHGTLDKIFVENVGRNNIIDWGDEKAGSRRAINFRLDAQNSSGKDVNLSIQAGTETIATVLFEREYGKRHDKFHDAKNHFNFLRAICDALLTSLEETLERKLAIRYRVVCK